MRRAHPVHTIGKLFCFLAVTAGIFFAWQGFVAKVQYFGVVAGRSRPLAISLPIASTIVGFVRKSLGVAPAPPPSAYVLEQQMSPSALVSRWEPLIAQASQRFGVPRAWLVQVMRMESGGRTMSGENAPIVSRAGAMGLMQLMPGTYADMRTQYGLGINPFDPHDNIFAGAAYLKWLHGKYGYPAMFAAYNDGPGNLEARMADGKILPAETRNYVSRIADMLGGKSIPILHPRYAMRTIRLTRPNGLLVAIDASQITSIHAAPPGEYAPGVRTVVTVGHAHQGVRESVAQVEASARRQGTVAGEDNSRRFHAVFFAESSCHARCARSSS